MGNNIYCDVLDIGTVKIMIPRERNLYLSDVLFAPTMRRNLISIPCLDEKGFEIRFHFGKVSIGKHGRILMWGIKMDGLYRLNDISFVNNNNAVVGSFAYLDMSINHSYVYDDSCLCMDDPYIWHMRLGHINKIKMKRMISMGLIPNMNIVFTTCEPCISSQIARLPFPKRQRSNELLAIVHSDVCVPLNIKTYRGMEYFVTFIDDFSQYGHIYLIHQKSEVFEKFQEYKKKVENQLGRNIKILQSNRGGEYMSDPFSYFLKENGIIHQLTMSYTPQQNGIAKIRNKTLLDIVRSMLNHSSLGSIFWGETIVTAMYLLNLVPTKIHNRTPHELWIGRKLNLQNLKVWGSSSCRLIPSHLRSKLDGKTINGTFFGYPENSKGYRFVIHHSDGTISVTKNKGARFLEEEIDTKDPNKLVELFEISKEKEVVNNEYVIVPSSENPHDTLSRIQRDRNPPTKLKDYFTFLSEWDVKDPLTNKEAL